MLRPSLSRCLSIGNSLVVATSYYANKATLLNRFKNSVCIIKAIKLFWLMRERAEYVIRRLETGNYLDCLGDVSNTSDSVQSGYPNTERRVENTTRSGVFLTQFKMFGDSRSNVVSSVWYIFQSKQKLRNKRKSKIAKLPEYANRLHGCHFLCIDLMNYKRVWEGLFENFEPLVNGATKFSEISKNVEFPRCKPFNEKSEWKFPVKNVRKFGFTSPREFVFFSRNSGKCSSMFC